VLFLFFINYNIQPFIKSENLLISLKSMISIHRDNSSHHATDTASILFVSSR